LEYFLPDVGVLSILKHIFEIHPRTKMKVWGF